MTLGDLFYFINCFNVNCKNPSDVDAEFEAYQPISLRGSYTVESDIAWEDVGGLADAKAILKDTIELPTRYSFLFDKYPLKLRTGVLLYGPPGCGKTLLAQAVAKECGVNFISVKGPELLDKYIGASEAAVRQIFAKARDAQPAVLFFDEFDATVPKRGSGSQTGVTDRIVNQFLCELDGVEALNNVTILAATSRPELIDPAILRPGRIDKKLYVGFPEYPERVEILTRLCQKLDVDGVDVGPAAAIEGFTGADYQGIAHTLQLDLYHERIDSITAEILQQECEKTSPSISKQDREMYVAQYTAFQEGKAVSQKQKVALM